MPQISSFLTEREIFIGLIFLIVFISLGGGMVNGSQLSKVRPTTLFRSLNQHHLHGNRLLRSLIILQFTISLTMLIFAFTIHSQLQFINKTDVGFDKDRLITVKLFDESKMKLFENLEQFLIELKSFAAIQDVTFSCSSPAIINTSAGEADWDGKQAGESLTVQWNSIFYNYFNTIGVELIAGRNFSDNFQNELGGDDFAIYILNEAAVKGMNLSNEGVIGRNFELYGRKGPVIGVVRDFHFKSLREKTPPMAFDMLPWWYNEIIIRTSPGGPPDLSIIENVYKKYLPSAPFQFRFINDEYNSMYTAEKKLLSYNSLLAFLMIVISALGLSSLAFLMVDSRTKEIGIRKINGATIKDIFTLLAGYFGKWILAAILFAVPVSLIFARQWLGNYEYKTELKFSFFLIPVTLIISISLLSIIVQVLKASKTNPVETLRYE
jgi:ABC-type antimicrobial peptide transport system permease subunit